MATLSLSRSKQELQKQGFSVWIVERWNQWAHKRQDLYGFADLVAIRSDRKGVLAVQACGEEIQGHIRKLIENPNVVIWLQAENPLFIWAWRKRGERGKRKTWELKEIEFILEGGNVVCRENRVQPTKV